MRHVATKIRRKKNNKGNALFLILIAVALFAALSYAVTQSGRGSGNINREQLDMDVAQTMQDVALVQSTVNRMLLTGCTKSQISFEGAHVPGGAFDDYTNSNAPGDNSCHIFDPAGGGLSYTTPLSSVLDSAHSSAFGYGHYFYRRNAYMQSPALGGISSYSVHLFLPYVNDAACLIVNQRMLEHNAIPQDTDSATCIETLYADGTFSLGGYVGCENNTPTSIHPAACGDITGCFTINTLTPAGVSTNILYQVLYRSPP